MNHDGKYYVMLSGNLMQQAYFESGRSKYAAVTISSIVYVHVSQHFIGTTCSITLKTEA